jgi:hypothetical protein
MNGSADLNESHVSCVEKLSKAIPVSGCGGL